MPSTASATSSPTTSSRTSRTASPTAPTTSMSTGTTSSTSRTTGFEGDPGGGISASGQPHPQCRAQWHQLPASERLPVVHHPQSAGRLHGGSVQVPDDHRYLYDCAQHDRDVEQDDLLQRCAPFSVDRQEQPLDSRSRRGRSGFRIKRQGLADRFQSRRFRLGRQHGAVQYGGVVYSQLPSRRGGERTRDERRTD